MTAALNIRVRECADLQAQAVAMAETVTAQLQTALDEQGRAVLAVSGGRSPLALFRVLRESRLDWPQVTVVLVDERCVPGAHADSNAHLVRDHLLQGRAAAARFIAFFDALPQRWLGSPAELAGLAAHAESRLGILADPLDVLVLGMGEDGHTASLFAGASGLDAAVRGPQRVAGVRPQNAPHARLTLTLPVLQQARHAHLAITGAAKRDTLARAMAGPSDTLPVSWVLHRPGSALQVWWAP